MDTLFTVVSAIAAAIGYLIIIWGIVLRNDSQSFATWALWTVIDIIVLINTENAGADATLAWVFTIGTGATAIILLCKQHISWGGTDTFIALVTGVCIILNVCIALHLCFDARTGIIIGTLAMMMAGIPNAITLYKKKPDVLIFAAVACMLIASAFTFCMAIATEKIESMIFTGGCSLYWLVATILTALRPAKK